MTTTTIEPPKVEPPKAKAKRFVFLPTVPDDVRKKGKFAVEEFIGENAILPEPVRKTYAAFCQALEKGERALIGMVASAKALLLLLHANERTLKDMRGASPENCLRAIAKHQFVKVPKDWRTRLHCDSISASCVPTDWTTHGAFCLATHWSQIDSEGKLADALTDAPTLTGDQFRRKWARTQPSAKTVKSVEATCKSQAARVCQRLLSPEYCDALETALASDDAVCTIMHGVSDRAVKRNAAKTSAGALVHDATLRKVANLLLKAGLDPKTL